MTTVKVNVLPACNFCRFPARYDALVPALGKWAYMCTACGTSAGVRLGLGVGQELVLEGSK